jgi:hypothetical protein
MNEVSGSSQLVGEREESFGLSLRVVKQEYLGQDATLSVADRAHSNGAVAQRPVDDEQPRGDSDVNDA